MLKSCLAKLVQVLTKNDRIKVITIVQGQEHTASITEAQPIPTHTAKNWCRFLSSIFIVK
jgi:hypothetical protein